MKDPALITLLSAVLSALITAIGTIIAAIIHPPNPRREGIVYPEGYIPDSLMSKIKRLLNKRSGTVILSVVFVGLAIGIGSWLWPEITSTNISVFSASYPISSTGITVNTGDRVTISANGIWSCGRTDSIGPNGYVNEKYNDTVFPNAPACALISAISPTSLDEDFDEYFLTGANKTWIVEKTGKLYLGCNDTKTKFIDNPTDSKLEVEIVVMH